MSDKTILWQVGQQYSGATIDPATVASDPFDQFRAWFANASEAQIPAVNAMSLATVDAAGWPAVRVVLLKEIDARGLVFFTNYQSAKAKQLEQAGRAAVVFHWEPQHRQVRAAGTIERVSAAESDAYFAVRPRGSQIGAIVSPQSQVIDSRAELEVKISQYEAQLGSQAPERPQHWGGYRIVPIEFEFWQGQPSRLHDRVRYRLVESGASRQWLRERLGP